MSFGDYLDGIMPGWLRTDYAISLKNKVLLVFYSFLLFFVITNVSVFSLLAWVYFQIPLLESGLMKPECINDGFRGIVYTVNKSQDQINVKMVKVYVLYSEPKNFPEAVEFCQNHNSTLWNVDGKEEWEAVVRYVRVFSPLDMWLNGRVEGEECPSGEECLNDPGKGLKVRWHPNQAVGSYSRLYRGETPEKKCLVVENSTELLWTTCNCNDEEHTVVCIKRNCFTGL
jgi:Lectin C-type domain